MIQIYTKPLKPLKPTPEQITKRFAEDVKKIRDTLATHSFELYFHNKDKFQFYYSSESKDVDEATGTITIKFKKPVEKFDKVKIKFYVTPDEYHSCEFGVGEDNSLTQTKSITAHYNKLDFYNNTYLFSKAYATDTHLIFEIPKGETFFDSNRLKDINFRSYGTYEGILAERGYYSDEEESDEEDNDEEDGDKKDGE